MTTRTAVLSKNAPAPSQLMSQAVIYNGTVYCSGSLGIDPTTGKIVEGGPYERTVQAIRNLGAILEAAGSDLSKVIKVNILSSMDYYTDVNQAYGEIFTSDPKPCRTCVSVAKLPLDAEVEIELVAALK
ncbi:putative l-ornithine transaminase [Botryosphaeria dothidea]|uniref:L-ornithine transaminase n=1 Tax=Botryosphaeria dothidea TaxID=55169 RepID=A0A8H4N1B6_9PEZI|nr:putative l-ornithine transaminase [Botryosphaeria dothidea]